MAPIFQKTVMIETLILNCLERFGYHICPKMNADNYRKLAKNRNESSGQVFSKPALYSGRSRFQISARRPAGAFEDFVFFPNLQTNGEILA
jgi:hypothetical protein